MRSGIQNSTAALAALVLGAALTTGFAGSGTSSKPTPAPRPAPEPAVTPSAGPAAMSSARAGTSSAAVASAGSGTQKTEIDALCAELRTEIKKLKWDLEPCKEIDWQVGGKSVEGRPLIYAEFGDAQVGNTTLVFTMVHGDEVTPLFLGLQLAHWLRQNPNSVKGTHVVIAPLVNPDSFFSSPRTRTNARGVDVNRNFPTKDWHDKALQAWKSKFKSNPRRYPGAAPSSEPETLFQEDLIKRVRPHKILSVHAPLNFMDYDGPNLLTLDKFPREYVQECLKLRKRLKAIHGGFFPGSLGNFAGQEMGIPTLTLELPSADPRKAMRYWNGFKSGIHSMITFKMPEYASLGLR